MISLCVDCKSYKNKICRRKWHVYGTKRYINIHVEPDDFTCDSFTPNNENVFYPIEKRYGENGDESSNVFE